ncbi:MAG: DUF1634 domain-containing protein [Candidatus Sulfotelmatobacter sp.]
MNSGSLGWIESSHWSCALGHSAASSLCRPGSWWGFSCSARIATEIERIGVLLMLAPPVVWVAVAGVLFVREKDWKYGAISFGVLAILLLGAVFGIGEHCKDSTKAAYKFCKGGSIHLRF